MKLWKNHLIGYKKTKWNYVKKYQLLKKTSSKAV